MNALQRHATVVVQTSLHEGFDLTVSGGQVSHDLLNSDLDPPPELGDSMESMEPYH